MKYTLQCTSKIVRFLDWSFIYVVFFAQLIAGVVWQIGSHCVPPLIIIPEHVKKMKTVTSPSPHDPSPWRALSLLSTLIAFICGFCLVFNLLSQGFRWRFFGCVFTDLSFLIWMLEGLGSLCRAEAQLSDKHWFFLFCVCASRAHWVPLCCRVQHRWVSRPSSAGSGVAPQDGGHQWVPKMLFLSSHDQHCAFFAAGVLLCLRDALKPPGILLGFGKKSSTCCLRTHK